ncbi:MAG: TetR/AcrR family transcriptional regulator [Gemmatimonadota bacterium]
MDARTRYDDKLAHILHRSAEVFAGKGFHQASMRDVSAATGVSLSGLYYYFRSKEELLLLIQTHAFETLLARLEEDLEAPLPPRDRLARVVSNHVRFFVDNMAQMKVLSHEADALPAASSAPVRALKRRYVALVGECLQALAPERGPEAIRLATFALFGQLNWIYTWYRPDRDPDGATLAEQLLTLFLQGFLGPDEVPTPERGGVSSAAFFHADARHQQD